jgi:hypothetical protein
MKKGPKVLIVDIETAPMLGYVWSLWENNVALNQLYKDWHLLSWSAKWLNDPPNKIMYKDQRNKKDIANDKNLAKSIWKLLDEADIIITQNGKAFDHKKLNARFMAHGLQPPSSYKHIDTVVIARKHFAFTSNKLEYMTDKFCTKYKKLKPTKFPGFTMWVECLNGNLSAWKEMEKYNKHDVLSLEELYKKLMPWDNTIDFNLYSDDLAPKCHCGSTEFIQNGHTYLSSGRYKRYTCKACGSETRGRVNTFQTEKRESLRVRTNR